MHGNHTEMTRLCSALTGAARRAFRPTPTRSSHFCSGGVQPLGWRRALSTAHDAGGSAGGSTGGSTGGGVSATVPLHWGEMDAFAHMNNVSYFRHFETARIVHFEAMVREGERRRRYQRTRSLSTSSHTQCTQQCTMVQSHTCTEMMRGSHSGESWRGRTPEAPRTGDRRQGARTRLSCHPSSPPSFTMVHSPTRAYSQPTVPLF